VIPALVGSKTGVLPSQRHKKPAFLQAFPKHHYNSDTDDTTAQPFTCLQEENTAPLLAEVQHLNNNGNAVAISPC
jgi:hypothetical protein